MMGSLMGWGGGGLGVFFVGGGFPVSKVGRLGTFATLNKFLFSF